eukprot:gnl/MRDRNA2_/MRDRNA2_32014_c0_seq2.p1 gnl/MRDRNA2_/MRDRNA2_32014_c0~~gnl/MRDRNA2_/MRDRNA2_32014_c0_seq2.p1  ORF type:complete len:246 (-),score=48.97 gnl/MRDRNA2_/MRDRNA2_32014_c0_seq2:191-895(-)
MSTESEELSELLPTVACASGVCKGKLPGCQIQKGFELHIATISFNFSRPVHWVPDAPFMLRDAVSFGMSMLPETVHVLTIHAEQAGTAADLKFAAEALLGVKSKCFDINAPGCAGRRLNEINVPHVFSSFTVGIDVPVHGRVDDKFLNMLVQHQAFDQISDGLEGKLGDIRVIGFRLYPGSLDPTNSSRDVSDLGDFFGGPGTWFCDQKKSHNIAKAQMVHTCNGSCCGMHLWA